LSSEECAISRIFAREEHVLRLSPATAAVGGVKIPIGAADVVGWRVAELPGYAVDGRGTAFEFEETADGGLVEVKVKGAEAETGSVFVVAKAGTKTDGFEQGGCAAGVADSNFAFEALFVTRPRFEAR
jgi:hypothetical protein